MRQTIAIVGNSPVSFFVAKLLDKDIARQVNWEVLYITEDENLLLSSNLPSLAERKKVSYPKRAIFKHVKLVFGTPRSINLKDKRIVGSKYSTYFSKLFLDRTAVYTEFELRAVTQQFLEIIARLKAAQTLKIEKAVQIHFEGESVWSWQIALALSNDLVTVGRSVQNLIKIYVDCPENQSKLRDFFNAHGISIEKPDRKHAICKISAPSKIVTAKNLKGLLLDNQLKVITDGYLRAEGHPETIVIDSQSRNQMNLVRSDLEMSKIVFNNLFEQVGGLRHIEPFSPSAILRGSNDVLLWLGSSIITGSRAKAALLAEKLLQYHFR